MKFCLPWNKFDGGRMGRRAAIKEALKTENICHKLLTSLIVDGGAVQECVASPGIATIGAHYQLYKHEWFWWFFAKLFILNVTNKVQQNCKAQDCKQQVTLFKVIRKTFKAFKSLVLPLNTRNTGQWKLYCHNCIYGQNAHKSSG